MNGIRMPYPMTNSKVESHSLMADLLPTLSLCRFYRIVGECFSRSPRTVIGYQDTLMTGEPYTYSNLTCQPATELASIT
jgi:hypothetical protein